MAHLLMIEDHPHNLELMTYLLRAAGHEVTAAVTAELGLRAARESRPDLIVLDIQLPDATGFEVLDVLRGDPELHDVRVVAVTANAMVGDRDHALSAGFDGYLAKPIEPAAFSKAIDSYLPEALRGHAPMPSWSSD